MDLAYLMRIFVNSNNFYFVVLFYNIIAYIISILLFLLFFVFPSSLYARIFDQELFLEMHIWLC